MEKNTQNGKAIKDMPKPFATEEQVIEWVKKDLAAAHYLLGLVLQDYPEVVTALGKLLHKAAYAPAPPARIDEVVNDPAQVSLFDSHPEQQ